MALSARLDVTVQPELRGALEGLAEANDMNLSYLVRYALAQWVARVAHENDNDPQLLEVCSRVLDRSQFEVSGIRAPGGERHGSP